jgi:hypothetical protein
MINTSEADYIEFQRIFCNIIPDSDAGECYLFREHCQQTVHTWPRDGIKANFPRILEKINIFMLESPVLAFVRMPLCDFIQMGNRRAVSVSILAQFLELSDKYTRICLQFSDWVEISFDPVHFPAYAQVFNEMTAHLFHRFNFWMRSEELPRETIPEMIPDTTKNSPNDDGYRPEEENLKFTRSHV